jgi:hypothetical protein
MAEYSKMSYEALRKIADNDSIADNMSDEEYESLSIELWRKFSAERGIIEHYATFVPSRPLTKHSRPNWAFDNIFTLKTLGIADSEPGHASSLRPRSK